MTDARSTLAWLMWCYDQGYTNPADRAILTNWIDDDPAGLTAADKRTRQELLTMADEILAALGQDQAAAPENDEIMRDPRNWPRSGKRR